MLLCHHCCSTAEGEAAPDALGGQYMGTLKCHSGACAGSYPAQPVILLFSRWAEVREQEPSSSQGDPTISAWVFASSLASRNGRVQLRPKDISTKSPSQKCPFIGLETLCLGKRDGRGISQ